MKNEVHFTNREGHPDLLMAEAFATGMRSLPCLPSMLTGEESFRVWDGGLRDGPQPGRLSVQGPHLRINSARGTCMDWTWTI